MRRVLLLSCALLIGCNTAPDSIRELDEISVAHIETYVINSDSAFEGVLTAYEEQARAHLLEIARHEIESTSVDEMIATEAALEVLSIYDEKLGLIDEEVASNRVKWEQAKTDYHKFIRARRDITDFLSRTGIDSEKIDAVTRAVEKYLETRQ